MNQREEAEDKRREQVSKGMGFSFPFGIPLVIYPLLLLGIFLGREKWWGYLFHLAYLGLIGLFLWEALSYKEYQSVKGKIARTTYVMNWLLFFVLLPLAAWMFAGLPVLIRSLH